MPSTRPQAMATLTTLTAAITSRGVRASPAPRIQALPMNISDEMGNTALTMRR